MNLDQLIAAGAIIPNSLVKKTIAWKHRNEKNKTVTTTFDVHIKKAMSAADFEYIHIDRPGSEGVMARRVSRLVLLGDDGVEKIPFSVAATMHTSLLAALCGAINEVEKENAPDEAKDEKK